MKGANVAETSYMEFIASKSRAVPDCGVAVAGADLSPMLFPFQRDLTSWALRRGRAALWADCGLGKSWMALEWARVVSESTGKPVLILTPLAVAEQFVAEGRKLGVAVTHARDGADIRDGINVCNYERLHKLDSSAFAGVVLDESSILKDYTSATRNALIEAFAATPYRLCCTATPAPNDHMELGNHAEFLGVMTRAEMLSMYFTHDGGDTSQWRIKGHAREAFWRWVCSWAATLRRPSDLGYSDDGFILPALSITEHVVASGVDVAREQGALFATDALTLQAQRAVRRASLEARVAAAAEIVAAEPHEPWLVWCELNDESSALASAIPGAVEVKGADTAEHKERALWGFARGEVRVLVSKPSIAGWGMNWQHCARAVYVGVGHSFESWYQSVRRIYRFGQSRPVECHVVISDADGAIVANLKRKQRDAEVMVQEMTREMSDITSGAIRASQRDATDYSPRNPMKLPAWARSAR